MIRRVFASELAAFGLSGIAAPVSGLMRMIDPSSVVGSAVERMSWLRSAPPSAEGGVGLLGFEAGSPQGLTGLPSWP